MKKLKAYEVREGDEGRAVIVFATNNATARREGASEIHEEWETVESCRRAPQFDEYAPGPVPPLVLIDNGWWMDCDNCYRKVSDTMCEELDEDGLDPDAFTPEAHGDHGVFCSSHCSTTYWLKGRRKEAAMAALIELFEAKFTGATARRYHVYEDKLCEHCTVTFTVPGIDGKVWWHYGSPDVMVEQRDVEAYKEWQKTLPKWYK